MAQQNKSAAAAAGQSESAAAAAGQSESSPGPAFKPEIAPLQFAEDTIKGLQEAWDEDRMKSLLSDLAGRKRSIESVLLEVVNSAQKVMQKSFKQTRKASQDEQRLNQQYRDQLAALKGKRKRSRARKGEIRISGQVLHPETGKPVSGVVVEAIDKDVRLHDTLGSVITNGQGKFIIAFLAKDYKESGEKEPEILLRVGSDRRNLSYVSEQPLSWAEVEKGDVRVTLSEDSARNLDGLAAAEAQQPDKRIGMANQALLKQELEAKLLDSMGDSASELLAGGIALLEGRVKKRT